MIYMWMLIYTKKLLIRITIASLPSQNVLCNDMHLDVEVDRSVISRIVTKEEINIMN